MHLGVTTAVNVLVIVLTFVIGGVTGDPIPEIVEEGADFRLFCPWSDGITRVMWLKVSASQQKTIVTITVDMPNQKFTTQIDSAWKPRTTLGYQETRSRFYFHVTRAQISRDYGVYACVVSGGGKDRIARRYQVFRPLKVTLMTGSSPVTDRLFLTEGVNTAVRAVIPGNNFARYTWIRAGNTIQTGSTPQLSLKKVTRKWTGIELACIAETSDRRGQVKATITVRYPPQVTSIRVDELADDKSAVRCLVKRGYPSKTQFTWQHLVKKVVVRSWPGAEATYGSWIEVKPKDFYNNGIYACLAKNEAGFAKKETALNKKIIKFSNVQNDVTAERNETVSLSVSFVSLSEKFITPKRTKITKGVRKIDAMRNTTTKGSKVVSFFGTNVSLPLHTYTLTLERVTGADNGSYTLHVDNPNGEKRQKSVALRVTVKPDNEAKDKTNGTTFRPKISRTTLGPDMSSGSISIPVLVGSVCGGAAGAIIITVIVVIVLVRLRKTPACCRRRAKQPRDNKFSNRPLPRNNVALNNVRGVLADGNRRKSEDAGSVYEELYEKYVYPDEQYTQLSHNVDEQNAINEKKNQTGRSDRSNDEPPSGSTLAAAHDAQETSSGTQKVADTSYSDAISGRLDPDTRLELTSETDQRPSVDQHRYVNVEDSTTPFYLELIDDNTECSEHAAK